ncbi:MAG: GNAT family N-acetyltransferase, partial [Bacteroidales bacterium]|nr:GNAT family N-acetyltransferase [Bacteroidales bacterium]
TNYCFDILKLHQIYCDIMKTNTESIALFKKAGFVETGTKKEWIKTKEGYIDQYIFQLINK